MDDIFKSKNDEQREEKINNLFRADADFKKADPLIIPKKEATIEPEKKGRNFVWVILLGLLFLIISSAAGYFCWQYKKVLAIGKIDEAKVIAEKVGTLMELPEGKPALATIAEQEKIIKQSFFAKALNGDKVLLYIQSQKVILYRPSSNEIIGTTALFFESELEAKTQNTGEDIPKQPEKIESKVKVDVLNGTETKGLAKETADKLTGMENVELAKVGNTQKSTYTKILVVDLSGKNATAAKIIATKIGGEVGTLPEGEIKGTADILIIAGKM